MKAKEIADFINGEIIGDEDQEVVAVNHLSTAKPNELAYCNFRNDEADLHAILNTAAGIVICKTRMRETLAKDRASSRYILPCTLILSDYPKCYFARVIKRFFLNEKRCISPSCNIGPQVKIGKDPDIHSGVVIHDGTIIGNRVTVRATAVLGGEGLSLGQNERGGWEEMPHLKSLIIEDDVTIGIGTTVLRGTLTPTIIGRGTKIGANCHISHQVKIGKHVVIPSLTLVSGHSEIGDYTYIGPHSTISNGVKIGSKCFVGIGSLVLHDVSDGQTVVGRPAIELEDFKLQRKRLKELFKLLFQD